MTAKNCTHATDIHSWWCRSYILLFPRWNFMGILILRGILKINKSISSKKPFAWIRANVQLVPHICSEVLQGDIARNVSRMTDEKMVKFMHSLKIYSPNQKRKDLIIIATKLTSNNRSTTSLSENLIEKIFSVIWSFLFRKLNCSVRLRMNIFYCRMWFQKGERKKGKCLEQSDISPPQKKGKKNTIWN